MNENEKAFKEEVFSFTEHSEKMLTQFFDYWSEPNKKGKMRWELEKTWDTRRRLIRWSNNQKQWHGSDQTKLGTSAARIEAARNF